MNKREIVERFLEDGIMISPEVLKKVDEKNYVEILEIYKGKNAEKDEKRKEMKKDGMLKEKRSEKDHLTTPKDSKMSSEEFIRKYNMKFEFLREILLKKTEAVSVNKGRKIFSEVVIIGRVKETTPRGFLIEDVTGDAEVVYDGSDIEIGDVLAAGGFFKENIFIPKQIIWPDIPLDNGPKPIKGKIILSSKDIKGRDDVVVPVSDFSVIKIPEASGEAVVIAHSPRNEMDEEAAIKTLKRRMVPADWMPDNLIRDIPNILWFFNNKQNWTKNYKGVVVVSTEGGSFAEYNKNGITFGKI